MYTYLTINMYISEYYSLKEHYVGKYGQLLISETFFNLDSSLAVTVPTLKNVLTVTIQKSKL